MSQLSFSGAEYAADVSELSLCCTTSTKSCMPTPVTPEAISACERRGLEWRIAARLSEIQATKEAREKRALENEEQAKASIRARVGARRGGGSSLVSHLWFYPKRRRQC